MEVFTNARPSAIDVCFQSYQPVYNSCITKPGATASSGVGCICEFYLSAGP